MFVTIRKYSGCTDVVELMRVVRRDLIPALEKIKGFHSYTAVKCGDHSIVSISMFETEEAAAASNVAAREAVKAGMGKLLPNPPEITVGHVLE